MRKVLSLARRAEGLTSPNPMVAALIVKDAKIIAQGYHRKAGLAHAEIEAFRNAPCSVRGATLYVNLEPCCHFGKTPPCVDEIIRQGIRRVVVAQRDPNPLVAGRSMRKLRSAGIEVSCGILSAQAERLNEVFFKNMRTRLPFVIAKVAQSLDGKIATHRNESRWITAHASRRHAHSLRDKYDSVLVGITTVVRDDPRLNGLRRIPYKIVIDPALRIPPDSFIVRNNPEKLVIVTQERLKAKALKICPQARIVFFREKNNTIDLHHLLKALYGLGITSIFVEGGSYTLGSFHQAGLIDKMHIYIALKVIGGTQALSSFGAQGSAWIAHAAVLKDVHIESIENDMLVTGYPCYA